MFMFPWGDFHSLNLGWFLQKFNELRQDWATAEAGIDGALDAEIQKAEDALTDVFAARDAAAASATAANSSALNASQSSIASMDARDQSRAARDAAQQAAGNAAASETAAGNSATAASNSAGAAATSATQAGNSATAAGNSATAAGQSATNAAASETAAGNSAAAAAASETAAGQSASNAEDAAASVEASTEQIATNTSNIEAISTEETTTPQQLGVTTSIDAAGRISNSTDNRYRVYYCPVVKGAKYKLISRDMSGDIVYAFYLNKPTLNSRSYNNDRIVTQSNEFISPITGYIAFRSNSTQTDESITSRTAIDTIARIFINLIAKELPQMIADTALTPNDFRIVNNVLYRITTDIASGGTLTVGTNVVETTVADVLKSLLN